MSGLFSYFDLGTRALSAARIGLQVAGDNIANASTPGYARRRVDLTPGFLVRVQGGFLDSGVEVARIRRAEDRFLQVTLERERGNLSGSRERLRGLQEIEATFGSLDGDGIASAWAGFTDAFGNLASSPESPALRRSAVSSAESLTRQIRDTYTRLDDQRRAEDGSIEQLTGEINRLANDLAALNRRILSEEADGAVAAPLRDQRQVVVESLVELTGGSATSADGSRVLFSLPSGTTLVNADTAFPLGKTRDANGILQLKGPDGQIITSRLRGGKLGALLSVRDDAIPARLAELDRLAADLITRANALTTSGTALDGSTGVPLFDPDPAPATGAARSIVVNSQVVADPSLLAISADGAPGDGALAVELSRLQTTASAALGNRTPAQFLAEVASTLGGQIADADVAGNVAESVLDGLVARRDSITGVSLDEEAVELVRFQRAFEAAARFIQVLNEVTETAINLR